MPLLETKPGGGYCAKATIKGVAVTFHLTPALLAKALRGEL
jgi:hypothetical protein